MSKAIYICSRAILSPSIDEKLNDICNRLSPDNIKPRAPIVRRNGQIALAVMNPSDNLLIDNNCLLLGALYSDHDNWHIPNTKYPDGSFALFRNTEKYCEVVSDPVGSRTIWYYFDKKLFVSSTSQRAIIMFLNSFEFNEKVIPWVLSSGSLGPDYAWDKRIKRIHPDSSILLNKSDWSLIEKKTRIEFNEKKLSAINHKKNLNEKLKETFDQLQLDYSKWYLPLSGGYDSRGILCFLANIQSNESNLKTITWGLSSAIKDMETDAYVAKKLSLHYGISHKYYSTDQSEEPMEKIFDRFIRIGEGRIDHISGYMDGFNIWKTLYEDGVQGIIRGDEGFGWVKDGAISPLYVRLSNGSTLCKDWANLSNYRKYGIPEQEMPEVLKRKAKETLPMWRDRIYHEYRLPVIIAGLTDLKVSFVEQISPLLSKNILDYIRQLPDNLRTNKFLFKELVNDFGLNIKYATKNAIANPNDILKSKEASNLFKKVLSSDEAKGIFHVDFLNLIINNIGTNTKNDIKSAGLNLRSIFNLTPNFMKDFIRKYIIKPKLDYNVIAFRVYIICKMHQLLLNDSNYDI